MGIEVSSEMQPGDILGDYKETILGKIPKYWNLTKLGDHVEDLIVPMRDKPKQFRGQIPWCRIDDFNGKYLYTSKNGYFVDKDTISKMNLKVFPKGTVICSCSANLGICAIAGNPLITNQTFIGIVPKNTFDTEFLYYLMISYAKRLQSLSTGTTISYLPKDKFENFIVVKPPLNEQRKIAAILSSVDAAIEQTDAIIAQTERMKKGLMQELLAKGIRHTDFRKTAVGMIPAEWDVIKIENLVMKIKQIDPHSRPNWRFKYIDVSSISRENLSIGSYKEYLGKNAPSRARKLIKTGDIIFSTVRPYLKQVSLIPDSFDGHVCSTAFCVIRCRPDVVDSKFLFQIVIRDDFIEKVSILQTGSNYPAVTDKDILCQLIPYPPFSEQRKIADILSSVDEKIEGEREYCARLKAVKRGLMQDLLTGRVRVKVDGNV